MSKKNKLVNSWAGLEMRAKLKKKHRKINGNEAKKNKKCKGQFINRDSGAAAVADA